jgi:chorismate mutase
MTLDDYRVHLDAIDFAIAGLLDERFRTVEAIGVLKRQTGQPYYDPAREQVVLARAAQDVKRPALVRAIFEQIIALSRLHQARGDEDHA